MNHLKTYILLAAMTALFGAVGYLVGGTGGMLIALLVAGAMNLFAYWNADKMVLRHFKAQESSQDTPIRASAPTSKIRSPWRNVRVCRRRRFTLSTIRSRTRSQPVETLKMPLLRRPAAFSACCRVRKFGASWRTNSPT